MAAEYCSQILALLPDEPPVPHEIALSANALWIAAHVAYARCFIGGARRNVPLDFLSTLDGEPVELHNYIIDMRNKHVAHSVNAFEQVQIGIVLDEEQGSAVGVGIGHLKRAVDAPEGTRNMMLLAQAAARALAPRRAQLSELILAEADAVPFDELRARPRMAMQPPGPEDVSRRR